jgi:hypothetical protein
MMDMPSPTPAHDFDAVAVGASQPRKAAERVSEEGKAYVEDSDGSVDEAQARVDGDSYDSVEVSSRHAYAIADDCPNLDPSSADDPVQCLLQNRSLQQKELVERQLPSEETRALSHVDPPFEEADDEEAEWLRELQDSGSEYIPIAVLREHFRHRGWKHPGRQWAEIKTLQLQANHCLERQRKDARGETMERQLPSEETRALSHVDPPFDEADDEEAEWLRELQDSGSEYIPIAVLREHLRHKWKHPGRQWAESWMASSRLEGDMLASDRALSSP